MKWSWKHKKGKVIIHIDQEQKYHTFKFPLEIGIINGEQMKVETVLVNKQSEKFEILVDTKPGDVVIDPESWLLFEKK